ncbi:MAG: hypothetical protein HY870_09010 [Chloroflexi bacterium]|nr:hypothetical protein [Chloroflexota bacterium]
MPMYYQRVITQTIEPVIYYGQVQLSNELTAQLAFERGMSLTQYAAYRNIVNALAALIPIGVAALIIWRARGQWFAWFTAFIIVFLGESALSEQMLVSQYVSVEVFGANAFFWFLVLPYFFLFPNGRAVPRRAAWLVGTLVGYHCLVQTGTVIAYVLPDLAIRLNLPNWGQSDYIWPVLLNFVVILACQVHRYRRVSTRAERQQTKWFLFGFGLIVALIPVSIFTDVAGQRGFLNDFTDVTLWIPLYGGLAIAITRYRLFDIDVIIRKTLVYSVLTGLLALIYFGGVVLVQQLTRSITASSDLAIAVSTLVIAALFFPLRRRVQAAIDRRFFRRKYDAARTLAAFGVTARDEVELDKLTAELLNVVSETMQPTSVSLWLRKP